MKISRAKCRHGGKGETQQIRPAFSKQAFLKCVHIFKPFLPCHIKKRCISKKHNAALQANSTYLHHWNTLHVQMICYDKPLTRKSKVLQAIQAHRVRKKAQTTPQTD